MTELVAVRIVSRAERPRRARPEQLAAHEQNAPRKLRLPVQGNGSPPIRVIQIAAAECAGISFDVLLSHARRRRFVLTRQIAMYLARTIPPGKTLPLIGRQFRRDHSTVIHGVERVRARLASGDVATASLIDRVIDRLRGLGFRVELGSGEVPEQMTQSERNIRGSAAITAAATALIELVRSTEVTEGARSSYAELSLQVELNSGGTEAWKIIIKRDDAHH